MTPIVVLDHKTGAFIRAFGENRSAASNSTASLIQHVHGLSWSAGNPSVCSGANLWATDAGWLPKAKMFGFHGENGTLACEFGTQGTGIRPQLQYGNVADTSWALNGSTVFVADGDMGINNRVSRLDAVGSHGDEWTTTWVVGNNHTPGTDPHHHCSPGGAGEMERAAHADARAHRTRTRARSHAYLAVLTERPCAC